MPPRSSTRGGSDVVRVEGLADFQRELRGAYSQLKAGEGSRPLAKASKTAALLVAVKARARARGMGGVAAKSAPSITAGSAQLKATISLGGARHPYALGGEFGAKRYSQFKPWRGNQHQPDSGGVGYFLYPTIRDTREEFIDVYTKAIDDVMRAAFPS